MKEIIIRRLREYSTWYAVIPSLVAFHVIALTPDQQTALMSVLAVLLAATPDKQHDNK